MTRAMALGKWFKVVHFLDIIRAHIFSSCGIYKVELHFHCMNITSFGL